MALDATATEANITDSIKKYFLDNVRTIEGKTVIFDIYDPNADITNNTSLKEWVFIKFGRLRRETLTKYDFNIYLFTRNDLEKYNLSRLSDTVFKYLSDTTKTDTLVRIPIYDNLTSVVGYMVIIDVDESEQGEAYEENINMKILSCTGLFGAKA